MSDKPNEVSVEGCIEFLEHEQREPRIGWTRFDTLGSSIRALRRYAQMREASTMTDHELREVYHGLGLLPFIGERALSHQARLAVEELLKIRAALKGPSP